MLWRPPLAGRLTTFLFGLARLWRTYSSEQTQATNKSGKKPGRKAVGYSTTRIERLQ
jgi:hypothetical protein